MVCTAASESMRILAGEGADPRADMTGETMKMFARDATEYMKTQDEYSGHSKYYSHGDLIV
jgi:hypothetical protein